MPNHPTSSTGFKIESRHWILIACLCVAIYASYLLIAPYVGAIVLAFIVSILFQPIHSRIQKRFSNSPNFSAAISCTLLTFIVLIPLLTVAIAIVSQGATSFSSAYQWVNDGGAKELIHHPWIQTAFTFINKWLPFDTISPTELLQKASSLIAGVSSQVVGMSTSILSDVTGVILNFTLMLFVLFFFLRDHDSIVGVMRHILPLSRSQEDKIFNEVEQVAKSAVLGSFLTAVAQGFAGGLAMSMAGFPGLFWGSMMGFASFIPFVGTALIWMPASIYLALTGDWQWGLFLAIWGVVVVGSIDNFLRPLLMQGSSGMSTLLLFFSLLGGIQLFGLIGLIYGPIIFAVTLVLFNLYETEFAGFLDKQDKQ